MTIEGFAYWASFFIPVILLLMSGFLRKLVDDGNEFKREHWYLGIDLTTYFLASALVNFVDVAKAHQPDDKGMWTALLVAAAVVMLFVQASIHQSWMPTAKRGGMQVFMLCFFGNFLGILLLYMFVELKTKGLI